MPRVISSRPVIVTKPTIKIERNSAEPNRNCRSSASQQISSNRYLLAQAKTLILTVVDYFTKYVQAHALHTKKLRLSHALISTNWFCASEFCTYCTRSNSQIWSKFSSKTFRNRHFLGIGKTRTSPFLSFLRESSLANELQNCRAIWAKCQLFYKEMGLETRIGTNGLSQGVSDFYYYYQRLRSRKQYYFALKMRLLKYLSKARHQIE